MLLSDSAIVDAVKLGTVVIDPFTQDNLGANSYDLTLGDTLLVYERPLLDAKIDNPTIKLSMGKGGFILMPNELYLAHTVETAGSTVYAPMVEGRSSYGRLGLDIHISAGFGDVGYIGVWTLELRVVKPLKIYPGTRICQICFHEVSGTVSTPYGARAKKYAGASNVIASRIHTELT